MKIDENFVSDFLKKVMRGAISSKEKQFLKDIQDFSGRVVYVDNVSQIIRAIDQLEDIKLTLRF